MQIHQFCKMASAGDSSDSDRNIGPAKNHGSSVKRLVSSSEDETTLEQCKTPSSARDDSHSEICIGSRRDSLRKRQKNFRLPSREEQWSSIGTDSKVSNKVSHLKPRKLINDFTRVTHRYNYDYEEVSGEESMEEFIKSSDSSESQSMDSSATRRRHSRKQKRHRVKGYRPKIVVQSDESSEEDLPKPGTADETRLKHQPATTAAGQQGHDQQSSEHGLCSKHQSSGQDGGGCSKGSNPESAQGKNSESSGEDTEPVVYRKNSLRSSVLDSENEKSSDESLELKTPKTSESSVLHVDTAKDTSPRVLSVEEDSQDIVIPTRKRARAKSALLSDSESEENDPVKKMSTDKQASILPNQGDNTTKEDTAQSSTCDVGTPGKELGGGTAVTKQGASPDSAIPVDGSDSSGSDESSASDDASQDSSDGVECSRIEKLAAVKEEKRNSMLDRFKAARAKRQGKK